MGYHLISTLKSSEKGDVQLVADKGRLYVRRYREIPQELFQRAKGISCPYVERFVEQSADGRGAYFISEYVEGVPASEREFTEKQAVKALLELCSAIKALHKAGVIHRDIKPSNIICGNDGHIRLTDFDSARLRVQFQSRDTELLGTEGYAPPEQYGFMQTDSRSDIYAFGVTMEELLGENADKPGFRRIIRRCTQFDPEKRYSDISQVRRAIKLASRPYYIPVAAGGTAVVLALIVFLLRGNTEPAPPGIVRLTDTRESAETIESESTAEAPETEAPTVELPETDSAENTAEETAEPVPKPPTEEVPPQTEIPDNAPVEPINYEAEPPSEISAPETAESAEPAFSSEESAPSTIEPEMPSADTPEMLFTTTVDEFGAYRDEFDYVFYDDPEVHGTWRAYRVFPGDTDIDSITGDDIFYADKPTGQIHEFISVYENGTLAFYQPLAEKIEPTNLWTNGYCISSTEEGGLVCRMKAFTIGKGKPFLALEQRPVRVSDDESAHRYVVYFKVIPDR